MRTSKGIRGLLRLKEYFDAHRFRFILGIVLFGVSRVLEASVFYFLGQGIDIIADAVQVRDQTGTLPALELGNTALMILLVVVVRYTVVTTARAVVRAAGLQISYELRQRLYERLQHQGLRFFNRYSVGDMMTRAIADISLIQRLFSYGVIMLVIMIYAPVVGLAFMLHYSPMLTLLILPPMPLVYFYANGAAQRLSTSSRDVQDRLSDLGAVVQENLSGIRTIQAMVQEDNEIRRFQVHNQAYADAFYEQSRVNSHMTAMMPGLAALSTIIIIGYGGHLVMTGAMTIGAFSAFKLKRIQLVPGLAVMMTIFLHASRAALITFDPYLGSRPLAEALRAAPPGTLMVDNQYYTFSSIFFYANPRPALLLNGRVNNLQYGSYAPGAPEVFIDDAQCKNRWASGDRHYLVIEKPSVPRLEAMLGKDTLHIVRESGGKYLFTNME